ncbi:PP2C family protein-serine/threonine phosphatase [Oligoflexus tunisiensis]|uniref:PP2C family protein-serine/threonine phosphatase n=1 Tax=Oligoflexus tunisiensis TaxID=708132 RepID=UPI001C4034DB|nr:SpoIIE family protein phosphatase [Oligoflexus tunisiensis]
MRQSFGAKIFVFTIVLVLTVVGSITFKNSQALRENLDRQYQSSLIDGTQLLGEKIFSLLTRWDNRLSYLVQAVLTASGKTRTELIDGFLVSEEGAQSLQIFRLNQKNEMETLVERVNPEYPVIPATWWKKALGNNEVRILQHPQIASEAVMIRRLAIRGSTEMLLLVLGFELRVMPMANSEDRRVQSFLLDENFRDIITRKSYRSIVPVKSFVSKAQKLMHGDLGAGYLGELKTPQGSYFVAYHHVPGYPLHLVTHQDSSAIDEAIRDFLWDMLRWTVLFVLIALFFSSMILRNLLANLRELYAATMRLGSGDFRHTVSVRSKDELGQLSAAFNLMTRKIVNLLAAEHEKARLDQELSVAQSVQNTFFKEQTFRNRHLLLTSFYQPASECGGDWWGHYPLGNNRELIVIGDATGHGVPAALVTAIAYASTHILAEQIMAGAFAANDPAAILRTLNTLLYQTLRGKLCMSFLALLIDSENRTLTFSNAGHPYPVLIPANVKDPRLGPNPKVPYRYLLQKRKSSCILGLEKDSVFYNETVNLVAGDKIILHTDGLTELENADGKQWGARPMKVFLQAHAHEDPFTLCKALMKDAISFNKKAQVFDDDLTLLILEFKQEEFMAA